MTTAARWVGRHPKAVLGAVTSVVGLIGALIGVTAEVVIQHRKTRHQERA